MKRMKSMKLKLQLNFFILHDLHALHGKNPAFYEAIISDTSGLERKSQQHATICVSVRQLQGKGRNTGSNAPRVRSSILKEVRDAKASK
jgi:hypothetical protein